MSFISNPFESPSLASSSIMGLLSMLGATTRCSRRYQKADLLSIRLTRMAMENPSPLPRMNGHWSGSSSTWWVPLFLTAILYTDAWVLYWQNFEQKFGAGIDNSNIIGLHDGTQNSIRDGT